MHRSGISAQAKSASPPLVARLSVIVALAPTIVIIVAVPMVVHSGGASRIHTTRPLPHNYFGR